MTRERIDELVSLVLEARGRSGISVSIGIERSEENISIYTTVPENDVDFTVYTTFYLYSAEGKRVIRNGKTLHVYDPNLEAAEEHIRRLINDNNVDR